MVIVGEFSLLCLISVIRSYQVCCMCGDQQWDGQTGHYLCEPVT